MNSSAKIRYEIDKDYKESFSQITKELFDENYGTPSEMFQKFKNSNKTGLIDRIERDTGINLEKYENDASQKSDMLRLAKYLLQVDMEFPLLKILSRPTFSKVSFSSQYDDYDYEMELENIRKVIREATSDNYAERSDDIFNKIINSWYSLKNRIIDMVVRSYLEVLCCTKSEFN